MRLPRIRFSIRRMLTLIAILAVLFGAGQWAYDRYLGSNFRPGLFRRRLDHAFRPDRFPRPRRRTIEAGRTLESFGHAGRVVGGDPSGLSVPARPELDCPPHERRPSAGKRVPLAAAETPRSP